MYSSLLLTDYFTNLKSRAAVHIKKDRDRYETIWNSIEKYCSENELIISNKYVLLDKTDDINNVYDKNYKIYTANPFRHANNLTNLIYQNTQDKSDSCFTRLKTIREHEEFVIDYDTRVVCSIYKLQKHKSVEPNVIIKPTKIKELYYMPAEIELIDIYHNLYNMSDSSAEDFEKQLFYQVAERKEKGILGSGTCKERKKELIEVIKVSLVKDWLYKSKLSHVLIGAWSINWIKLGFKDICTNVEKIQIISQIEPNALLQELKRYINEITPVKITFREQELHIPKDFRTSRYTYYISIPSEKGITEKPFLDLFNSANFEVIPYSVVDKIAIGHKWVLLRFLFIDLWIIRVIKTLGLISSDILNKKIIYLWELIEFLRSHNTTLDISFLGTYKDFTVDKRMSNLQEKMFYPYYPYIYNVENGSLRVI